MQKVTKGRRIGDWGIQNNFTHSSIKIIAGKQTGISELFEKLPITGSMPLNLTLVSGDTRQWLRRKYRFCALATPVAVRWPKDG